MRVLITGGSSGIGAATARAFLDTGAKVAVLDLPGSTAPEGAEILAADVTNPDEVKTSVGAFAERAGGLDVLVNSAGISSVGTVEQIDPREARRVLDVNVMGVINCSAAALPHLRCSAHAAIVNVCSIAASNGIPNRALYSASKGAVLSLTLAMAVDHLPDGVRVNAVNPGTVSSPFIDRIVEASSDPAGTRAQLDARQPTGRMVSADEVAGAILYLASPVSTSTVGAVLDVDGGLTRLRPAR